MDDAAERKLLVAEIMAIETAITSAGGSFDFPLEAVWFESQSTTELRALKTRMERLVRSLGGAKS